MFYTMVVDQLDQKNCFLQGLTHVGQMSF